jgi:hypothetical protein
VEEVASEDWLIVQSKLEDDYVVGASAPFYASHEHALEAKTTPLNPAVGFCSPSSSARARPSDSFGGHGEAISHQSESG